MEEDGRVPSLSPLQPGLVFLPSFQGSFNQKESHWPFLVISKRPYMCEMTSAKVRITPGGHICHLVGRL